MRSLALLVLAAMSLIAADPPPKPVPGLKAARDIYQGELDKARKAYVAATGKAAAEHVEKLKEIQAERTKAGDLDGAVRIRELIREVEVETPEEDKNAAIRKKLAGSVWVWNGADTLELKRDGSLEASWAKDNRGYWHVNPDGTVVWWLSKRPFATIMRFNPDYTSHSSYVPERDEIRRSGKRLK